MSTCLNELASLQKKAIAEAKKGAIDYEKVYFKLGKGENVQLRIVPSKVTPTNPFYSVKRHWGIGKGCVSLESLGKADPVAEYLKTIDDTPDAFKTRQTWLVPVIVRGQESKGVRMWEITATVLNSIIDFMMDEDYGDIANIKTGRDLKVSKSNEKFPTYTVQPRVSANSLDDAELKMVDAQPKPEECVYIPTYEKMKEMLDDYLHT